MTVCLNHFCLASWLTRPSAVHFIRRPMGFHRLKNFANYNFSLCQSYWNCVIEFCPPPPPPFFFPATAPQSFTARPYIFSKLWNTDATWPLRLPVNCEVHIFIRSPRSADVFPVVAYLPPKINFVWRERSDDRKYVWTSQATLIIRSS